MLSLEFLCSCFENRTMPIELYPSVFDLKSRTTLTYGIVQCKVIRYLCKSSSLNDLTDSWIINH